jgi:hypothetical protein
MTRNRRLRFLLAASGVLVLTAASALAMSGTDQIAWRGKPVAAQPDWPKGALDLVNDPLRTEGWNPWFSECPNDVNFYAFAVSDTNQVNHLIAKLAAIKADRIKLLLSPAPEPRVLAFATVLEDGNDAAAVFSIGSQKRTDEWYQHLREVEPGVREFGVHLYHEPPKAQPPTLTLYVGHKAIDLKGLKVPPSVEVSVAVSAAYRSEGKQADLIKAIDDFAARHPFNPAKPANNQHSKQ